jgi:hypothetical protein
LPCRDKDDLHLVVPRRFFVHGQHAQGDRNFYAFSPRLTPEKLLGLFERTSWPIVPAGTAVRPPVFKCHGDYEECVKANGKSSMCLALPIICLAKHVIPFVRHK